MTIWSKGGPVIVGVPDVGADALLPIAVGRAREHDVAIDLVRVWRTADWLFSASESGVTELARDEARDHALLNAAAEQIRETAPDVPVIVDFAAGDLYCELLDRTRGASVLVLGDNRDADSSITEWYLEHAFCPVVVVAENGHVVAEAPGTMDLARYGPHRS